jgi:hypothetical protein
VDWNEVYIALNCTGFSDPRFHAANFKNQPCRHIFKVLESVLRRQRERINSESVTTGRLAQVVQTAASMGKAQSTLSDWLPYDIETDDGRPRLSAEAAKTLRDLVRSRALPMPVMAFLMEDLKSADLLA